ncbi:MAG: type II toxin-antitoxin system RelE/ParE family toxin [Rhizobiaceae bacterium]
MTLVVTPRATRDFEEIHAYIALDDRQAADRVAQKLVAAMKLLDAKPLIGRPAGGSRRREWSVPNLPYVIPYRISGDRVIILRVYHTARKRPPEW